MDGFQVFNEKNTENKIYDSEKYFSKIFNGIKDIVSVLTPDLKIEQVNKYTKDLYNEKNPIIGRYCYEVYQNRNTSCQDCPTLAAINKKKTVTNFVPYPDFKNPKKWLLLSSYPLLDEQGNVVKIIEFAKDVTDINDMKEAVKKIEFQYRLLADNITDVIYTMDMNQSLTFVSPSAEAFIGYSLDELYTIDFKDILTPESYQLQSELMQKKLETPNILNESDKIELQFVRKTGEEFWGEIHVRFITNDNNEPIGIIGSARDIDRRKKAELELSYNYKKLDRKSDLRVEQIQRLLNQRDDFVIQLGHDLKTRLIPLVSLLPIIERKETDPELKELLRTVSKSTDSLTHLVKRMSRFMQIDSSQIQLQLENLKLYDVVNHVMNPLTDKANDLNGINFVNNIDENLEIKADRKLLEEIFGNLLMNSVKYSPHGGIITINANKENLGVVISVQDQGIGLMLEQMNRIFELFYKADQSRHDLESTGLGLAIVKRIVEKHKGHIWVESEGPDKGCTFFFIIPNYEL